MRLVAATVLCICACGKSGHEPTQAPVKPNNPHGVHVAPDLVASGRIRLTAVEQKAPSGKMRLAADVLAAADGAAEAGTLLAGRLAKFDAVEGDAVKRGQIIAWVEAPEAARDVADVIRARARVETLSRKAARLEALRPAEAVTQLTLDEARLELDLARADLNAARTLCSSLGIFEPTDPSSAPTVRLPVRSPVDGVIVERSVSLGAHVAPDARIFRIASPKHLVVDARAPEGSGFALAPKTPASIISRGQPPCPAEIQARLPIVDQATRTQRIRVVPSDACPELFAGAQVEVEVSIMATQTNVLPLVVPSAAIVDIKTGKFVFTRGLKDGNFDLRAVEPGPQLGSDSIITSGLNVGEQVVVDGTVLLKGELLRAELGGEE